jgi:hypothetical protein
MASQFVHGQAERGLASRARDSCQTAYLVDWTAAVIITMPGGTMRGVKFNFK